MNKIVYLDLRADNGLPYYVGAGDKHRACPSRKLRYPARRAIHEAVGTKTVVIATGLGKEGAHELEALVISECRRKSIPLVNISSGGCSGTMGVTLSEDKKRRMSEKLKTSMLGNRNSLGYKWSDAQRERMRQAATLREAKKRLKLNQQEKCHA